MYINFRLQILDCKNTVKLRAVILFLRASVAKIRAKQRAIRAMKPPEYETGR